MPDFVRVLLQHHADTNISDAHFLYPIHAAAKAGHEDIVEILLNHGVDVNLQMKYSGQTSLHIAAIHSRKEVIELLVKLGILLVFIFSFFSFSHFLIFSFFSFSNNSRSVALQLLLAYKGPSI